MRRDILTKLKKCIPVCTGNTVGITDIRKSVRGDSSLVRIRASRNFPIPLSALRITPRLQFAAPNAFRRFFNLIGKRFSFRFHMFP